MGIEQELARQWAALVEGPGDPAEKVEMAVALSRLSPASQMLSLSRAQGRDGLVAAMLDQGEYGALLALLCSDLCRWLPGAAEFSRLQWLLGVLQNVLGQSAGQKAKVSLGAGVPKKSAALLAAIADQAQEAAAGAWVRCLGGPGGEHRVWELPPLLADSELARAIFSELARHPRELALLLEQIPAELDAVALSSGELRAYLRQGAAAARFCYETITAGTQKLFTS